MTRSRLAETETLRVLLCSQTAIHSRETCRSTSMPQHAATVSTLEPPTAISCLSILAPATSAMCSRLSPTSSTHVHCARLSRINVFRPDHRTGVSRWTWMIILRMIKAAYTKTTE
eukprot:4930241-Pleurochrysis_carterae.AAC.12